MKKTKKAFRYAQLAAEIEQKIFDGTYPPGAKLPSIRKLHLQSNLSISTVYQAYVELETMGLVEVKPKSGYYVNPVALKKLQPPVFERISSPPQEVRLSSMINSVVSSINDPNSLPLGMTVTDTSLLPYRQFARTLKEMTRDDLRSMLSYSLSEGYPELRRQIAQRTLGVIEGVSPEDIIVTNGCMEAVALSLLAVAGPGETIAIEAPTNFGFLQLLKELGVLVVEVPTDPHTGVMIDELEKIIRKNDIRAGLFMPNFHNPLGTMMPDRNKKELVRLLSAHEIPVIEDDISSEVYFGEQRPLPLKAFDRNHLVLTCSSFSKTLAPGLRVGWVIPGKRYKEKIQSLKAGVSVSTSTLDQYLIARFLASGAYERHLRSLRSSLKKQMLRTVFAIQQHFPPHTRLAVPQGGSLLWVELPGNIDSQELYRQARGQRISIIPGVVCSNTRRFKNYMSISCGIPFTPAVERGIETLGNLIQRMT